MLGRFIQIPWIWRKRTTGVWKRTIPLILTCIVHFATIAIAGLFSSRVADTADEALVRANGICGWYNISLAQNSGISSVISDNLANSLDSLIVAGRTSVAEARTYARTCYPRIDGFDPDTSSASCSSTVESFLKSTVNYSAPCPFAPNACEGAATSFDSGWIDSHTNLGINSAPQDRVQIRRVTTCVPVPAEEKYSGDWFESSQVPGLQFKPYFLGPSLSGGQSVLPNATFVIDNMTLPLSTPYDPT
jgi:hypothetical protein